MCATIVDRVATAALAWFNKMIPAKKHAANEHTVFSAIVVHESWDSDDVGGSEQFRVVSAGTGTKCVGVSGLCREGFVVADSHAETICRRSFLRYLYHELKHAPSDSIFDLPPPSSSSPRDDATPSHRRRHLKPSCQLYMYVSEAPCGDAALYDLTAASLEVIHEAKVKKQKVDHRCDSVVATVPCRTTGAKEAHSTAHSNVVGVARVKSGRSDILQANRTMSMSCSDKLCQWMVCGLQGALLSRWFDPIVLHGVVVSQPEDADPASFHDALRRCVSRGRNCATFPTSSHPFRLSKSPTRPSPSGLSLNWAAGCPDDSAVEYTIGARGVKMGAKKTLDDFAAKQKMSSRLCRRRLGRLAFDLAAEETSKPGDDSAAPTAQLPCTYDDLKTALQTDYCASKKALRALPAFQTWRGNPAEYSAFALP